MQKVYVLQHLHALPNDADDVKLIGVYGSREGALEAIRRSRVLPGFQDYPALIDPLNDAESETSGFYLDEYQLDVDHWIEGFVTA